MPPPNCVTSQVELQYLSGPEIETLADYLGQGSFGVYDILHPTSNFTFHPIIHSYDDPIAISEDKNSELSMSTDSNRSENRFLYPKRTCIEFRSGPKPAMTEEVLNFQVQID